MNKFDNRWDIISAKNINEYLDNQEAIVIDIRDEEDYNEYHIGTSVNIPVKQIKENINKMSEFKIIILYCSYGNISLKLARKLVGRLNNKESVIYSVYGGIDAYKKYMGIDKSL